MHTSIPPKSASLLLSGLSALLLMLLDAVRCRSPNPAEDFRMEAWWWQDCWNPEDHQCTPVMFIWSLPFTLRRSAAADTQGTAETLLIGLYWYESLRIRCAGVSLTYLSWWRFLLISHSERRRAEGGMLISISNFGSSLAVLFWEGEGWQMLIGDVRALFNRVNSGWMLSLWSRLFRQMRSVYVNSHRGYLSCSQLAVLRVPPGLWSYFGESLWLGHGGAWRRRAFLGFPVDAALCEFPLARGLNITDGFTVRALMKNVFPKWVFLLGLRGRAADTSWNHRCST